MALSNPDAEDLGFSPPEKETAVSRGMIKTELLDSLPPKFKAELIALTPSQLRKLRVAICGHDQFDFQGLPVETRFMIYKFLFTTTTGLVRHDRRKPIASLSILQVSKNIFTEAMMIFGEQNACNLSYNCSYPNLDQKFLKAVENFRSINVQITLRGWYVDPYSTTRGSPAGILYHIQRTLSTKYNVSNHAAGAPTVSLNIAFRLHPKGFYNTSVYSGRVDAFSPTQTFGSSSRYHSTTSEMDRKHAAFLRVQLSHLVSLVRAELARRSPNVTLVSNVESPAADMETERVCSFTAKFRCKTMKTMGVIKIKGSNKSACAYRDMEIEYSQYNPDCCKHV